LLQRRKNIILTILTDFEIVEFHFRKEFRLFNPLRDFNLLLLLFIGYNLSLFVTQQNPAAAFRTPTFLMSLQEILLIIFICNTFFVGIIHWIIVDYSNPVTPIGFIQTCAEYAVIAGGAGVSFLNGFPSTNSPAT
jgi:hypothetical protein